MRIGIEAQRLFRPKKHGMDIYALQLIRHLQKIDHVNDYFIFVRPDEDICLAPSHNFQIVQIKALTYADWEQIWLPQKIKEYRLDMLHCTSNTAPLHCSVPTVVTIHDIIYLNSSFSGGSWYQQLGHFYRKWIVPQVYNQAKKVITVSDFESQTIKQGFDDVDKLEVIYNGINPLFNKKSDALNTAKVRHDLALPEKYLLFLGNTAPKKNMAGVLTAFAHYRSQTKNPLPLVIVETPKEKVIQMLENLGISEAIEGINCTGYITNDNLPVVYQEASLFLYPSLRESFGIPVIEAMASGTPVITSSTSSMPEIAQDAAHYVDPYSSDMLTAKMIELLGNENEMQRIILKGYSRASQFSWTHTAEEVLRCYSEVHHDRARHMQVS